MPKVALGPDGVSPSNLGLEIMKGSIKGHSGEIKFGDKEAVGTTQATVFGVPTAVLDNYFPTSAVTVNFSSSDANDTSAGTGARTIEVTYLDENFDVQTEIVTLSGQTPVSSAATMIRINRIKVITAGTLEHNAGDLYAYTGTATAGVPDDNTVVINAVSAEHNQTTSAFYTVPANHTAYVVSGFASVAASKTAEIRFLVKDNGVFRTAFDFDLLNSPAIIPFPIPIPLAAKSDTRVVAAVDVGTGRVAAAYQMIIVENKYLK